MESEKQVLMKGAESTVQQSRRSLNSNINAINTASLNEGINSLKINDFINSSKNNVQLPNVERWGCEWPSELNKDAQCLSGSGLESVDHVCQNGSRLTDSESHKAQHDVNFVTGAQQGESSSGTSNSGILCCDTNDSSSTDSEDDEDDGFSSDLLSLEYNKKRTTADGYNLTTFDQVEYETWAITHPLPLPLWAEESKPTLTIDKFYEYENLVTIIETTLQHMLKETYYDTVNNVIDFYQSFKKSPFKNLRDFYQDYSPPINRRHHMCVSLAMEIFSRVAVLRPDIAEHFYLVSCQEAIKDTISYIEKCEGKNIESAAWSLEKEHSLLAMKIVIGGREGLIILDPGYHVARAVTIMKDQSYPHTGFFTQSDEPECIREYCYMFSHKSDNFITWRERSTRNGQQKYESSLIYVDRPYKTAIDVTVRRNLVYDFRSLLSRDAKGRVFAGIYFPISPNTADPNFTIFYSEGIYNKILKTKIKFAVFKDVLNIPETVLNHLKKLDPQIRIKLSAMINMFKTLADIRTDTDFINQSLCSN